MGALIAGLCLLAYLLTGDTPTGNDATANVHQAKQLLRHGSVYFTPEQNPMMFRFAVHTPDGVKQTWIRDWRTQSEGQPLIEAYRSGAIKVDKPMYYLVPTRLPGKFANTFGPATGLFALPVVLPAMLVVDPDGSPGLLWWLGKLAAALSVAGAVAFLFFAAAPRLSVRAAAALALAYGLGSCAYSISSQALWQHGPCEFFLAMGAYFLLADGGRRRDLLCGAGFALAVACRPTSVMAIFCVGSYLLLFDRRRLAGFAAGALPVAVALMAYSLHAFGSPFFFGQLGVSANVARAKTGSPDLWQTPLFTGLSGLLFSPGRGLVVYSPIAVFSLWGCVRAFRDKAWAPLRPLVFAALGMVLLAAKWFDWWGGWCFGYRPIVDVAILLAFLALPVGTAVGARPWARRAFAALLVYSVTVQVLGAFAYDLVGWNARRVYTVHGTTPGAPVPFDTPEDADRFARERGGRVETTSLNVDTPAFRGRLWSVVDSPIVYYLTRFSAARENRATVVADFLRGSGS